MLFLAMVFHAPLQSWGAVNLPESNSASPRKTHLFPTKSAVIGLLRSALGVERGYGDELDLDSLRILSRADRVGRVQRDYQISQRTHHGFNAGTTKEIPKMFLEESTFVVLVGHKDTAVVEKLSNAIQNPEWAPFFGRRAHVPSLPISLGTATSEDPRALLQELPVFWGEEERWLAEKTVPTYDSVGQGSDRPEVVIDQPVSFHPRDRNYTERTHYVFNTKAQREPKKLSIVEQYIEIRKALINVH